MTVHVNKTLGVTGPYSKETLFSKKYSNKAFRRCYYLTITDPFTFSGDKNNVYTPTILSTPSSTEDYTGNNSPSRRLTLYQNVEDTGLAIDFKVTLSLVEKKKKSQNNLRLKIYNMSPSNQALVTKGDVVSLDVGYNNNVGNIFVGVIKSINSHRNGSDYYIDINATELPPPNFSLFEAGALKLKKGMTYKQVLESICRKIVDIVPHITGFDMSGANSDFKVVRDLVIFNTKLVTILQNFLQVSGKSMFIHSGIIYAIEYEDTGKPRDSAVVTSLSPSTGMIGLPTSISKSRQTSNNTVDKKETPGWRTTSLLNPNIRLGDYLEVDTENSVENRRNPNAVYATLRIERLTHEGNSFSGKWISVVDGFASRIGGVEVELEYIALPFWKKGSNL